VTARLAYITARPRYSDHSNGPIALTILSYVIAETKAVLLPTSSAHHAAWAPPAVKALMFERESELTLQRWFPFCADHERDVTHGIAAMLLDQCGQAN
jgi:hypothetical protein